MPCFRPLTAFRVPGRKGVEWSESKAGKAGVQISLPCGQCVGCRRDKAEEWGLRCVHEAKAHPPGTCHFVTSTYSDDHLPANGSLSMVEHQQYMRRLRYRFGQRVPYLACGEMGSERGRPHFHHCLFGLPLDDLKPWRKSSMGGPVFKSAALEEVWGKGFVDVQPLTFENAVYTCKYIMKRFTGQAVPKACVRPHPVTGELHEVEPEFLVMSKHPGIGAAWFEQFGRDAFPSDFLVHDGAKHRVPRYYLKQLRRREVAAGSDAQASYEVLPESAAIVARRKLPVGPASEVARVLDRRRSERTPDRLAVREFIAMRKALSRSRSFDGDAS